MSENNETQEQTREEILEVLDPETRAMIEEQIEREVQDALTQARSQTRTTEDVGGLNVKVSPKGAVSIYGFGRFPMTAYPKNLLRILNAEGALRLFLCDHKESLVWEKNTSPGEKAPEDEDILGC